MINIFRFVIRIPDSEKVTQEKLDALIVKLNEVMTPLLANPIQAIDLEAAREFLDAYRDDDKIDATYYSVNVTYS